MSDASKLGRLERIDLRDIWRTEAQDFTPWLAQAENMEILGKTLGLELEVEAQEKNVGPFRADILCKDLDDDSWVLIENQLERTDHNHLGQLLTYGAGLNTVTIIWIAEKFTDEHRAALDWLNDITDESFKFFGLEVELWRIGESAPAPKFNIISKPNEWSRSVGKASKRIETSALTETKQAQLAFWEQLHQQLQNHSFLRSRKPRPQHWTTYSVGRSGMHLGAIINTRENRIGVELYLGDENATAFFNLLQLERTEIEQEINAGLEWKELPTKRACRIITYLENVDPLDKVQWPRLHEWLHEHLEAYHKAFKPRVIALDSDDYSPQEEDNV